MAYGRPGRWPMRLLIAFVLAIPIGIGVAVYRMRGGTIADLVPALATPAVAPTVGPEATPSPAPSPSPTAQVALDASDEFIRTLVAALSSRPAWATWLATEGLARRFVVVTDNVAEGIAPTKHLGMVTPKQQFEAKGKGGGLIVDPASYRRYDGLADVVASIDTKGAAEAYRRLKPLLAEAYKELGRPDRDFDATLAAAIDRLLATPVPKGDVALVAGVKSYKLADPKLESLSPAQKQLLRMGPENVEKVQKKLREIREEIGLSKRPA